MATTPLSANALALVRRGALVKGKKQFVLFPGTLLSSKPGEGDDVVQFPPAGRNVSAIVTAPGVSLIDIAEACVDAFWPDATAAFAPQLATAILVRSAALGYVSPQDGDGPFTLEGWYVGARVILPLDYSEDRSTVTVSPKRAVESIFNANPKGYRPLLDKKSVARPPLAASYGKDDLIRLAQRNAADAADLLTRLLGGSPVDRAALALDFFNLESTPDLEHLWATTDGRALMRQLGAILQTGPSADLLRRAAPPEGGADRSVFMSPDMWADAVARARFMVTWFRTGNLPPNFVLDPNLSSLDLLPAELRDRFKGFAWGRDDYPGGPAGANEARAKEMATALTDIRPERRANAGPDAVVSQSEFAARSRYISSELRAVPDFSAEAQAKGASQPRGQQINRQALDSFVTMRDAAWSDGIPLIVLAGYRTPETAASNAAASGNSFAVASFSSHMLGLAVDLQMSVKKGVGSITQDQTSLEMTTVPMQNVVDMRKSPVHKWMFVNGEQYGWYPYQNEPWHWEYNPPGFRELFKS